MRLWIFIALLPLLSALFTRGLIYLAHRFAIMDVPNDRSAHNLPIPRGGGVAVLLSFFVGLLAIYYKEVVSDPLFFSILFGGLTVGGIGWVDDKFHISIKKRLVVQVLAAVFAVWNLGGLPQLPWQDVIPSLVWLGYFVAVIAIVWSINLFNFMDGINGLAGFEAFFVSISAATILMFAGQTMHAASLCVLSTSILGFLWFNFPLARIFMGDTGSCFLGFAIAVYALGTSAEDTISPWSWLILYGYFVVDASVTLATRIATGQRWYEGHNLHAYQKWARKMDSHTSVTLLIAAINFLWLLPMAWAATEFYTHSFVICLLAYMPLLAGVIYARAGRVEHQAE